LRYEFIRVAYWRNESLVLGAVEDVAVRVVPDVWEERWPGTQARVHWDSSKGARLRHLQVSEEGCSAMLEAAHWPPCDAYET